uniref:Uncharacterized protein n=1 Tax=Tanacetum cinerariifolium TaxID=118510 RepID=A0A6L2JL03_TANCI|nr:hypothetical protein [Tanacetum cinerariifolium]
MVTLGELLDEPVEETVDRLENKWWQYDVDNWAGVTYDGEGNIVSVRDEYGNWSPFQIQEVAANHDQELVCVQDKKEVKNVNDQEGENAKVEGVKSSERNGVNESQKGLVGNVDECLGLKRGMTEKEEKEHQEGLESVKTASATGNIATSIYGCAGGYVKD